MNNIDKILKEALNGYEAPFDSAMWDKVSSQLSPMEDALRNSLENHEVPYNPNAWSSIKNKIGSSWTLTQWITGSAAAIALVATAIVFWPSNEAIKNEDAKLAVTLEDDQKIINQPATDNNANEPILTEENTPNDDNVVATTTLANANNSVPNNASSDNRTDHSQPIPNNTSATDSSIDRENNLDRDATHLANATDSDRTNRVAPLSITADFKASAYTICEGTTILLNPKVSKTGTSHTWDFGDGTTSNESNATHNYLTAGTFIITHTIRENNSTKILASDRQSIVVNPLPSVDYSSNQPLKDVPSIDFEYTGTTTNQVLWSIDGNVVSDQMKFQQTFREKGEHIVELSVSNIEGCNNTAIEKIEIEEDYNLFAPTAFTPNGDNNNDQFIPVALTLLNNDFKLLVYDFEGQLVYQTTNANTPWDGRDIRTQTEAEAGVYVWFVTLTNENGVEEIYRGQVLLVR